MKKKIITNILVAFILLPILFLVQYCRGEINRGYPNHYTFFENIQLFLHAYGYMIPSLIFILLILWPFQSIKDRFFEKGKQLSFFQKWILFSILLLSLIVLWGSFSNIWMLPWWHNIIYVVFSVGFGLICNTILYFGVDRYVEQSHTKEE